MSHTVTVPEIYVCSPFMASSVFTDVHGYYICLALASYSLASSYALHLVRYIVSAEHLGHRDGISWRTLLHSSIEQSPRHQLSSCRDLEPNLRAAM